MILKTAYININVMTVFRKCCTLKKRYSIELIHIKNKYTGH